MYTKPSFLVQETIRPKSERISPVFEVVVNSPEISNHGHVPRDIKACKGRVPHGQVWNRQGVCTYNGHRFSKECMKVGQLRSV